MVLNKGSLSQGIGAFDRTRTCHTIPQQTDQPTAQQPNKLGIEYSRDTEDVRQLTVRPVIDILLYILITGSSRLLPRVCGMADVPISTVTHRCHG